MLAEAVGGNTLKIYTQEELAPAPRFTTLQTSGVYYVLELTMGDSETLIIYCLFSAHYFKLLADLTTIANNIQQSHQSSTMLKILREIQSSLSF